MLLEGSRALSLAPQGSFGGWLGINWMLGTVQERLRNILSPKTKAGGSKWKLREGGPLHAAA